MIEYKTPRGVVGLVEFMGEKWEAWMPNAMGGYFFVGSFETVGQAVQEIDERFRIVVAVKNPSHEGVYSWLQNES